MTGPALSSLRDDRAGREPISAEDTPMNRFLITTLAVAGLVTATATAETFTWVGPSGGLWDVTAN